MKSRRGPNIYKITECQPETSPKWHDKEKNKKSKISMMKKKEQGETLSHYVRALFQYII